MPNIRIKDIPTTASATSSTDFIAIDGATNGTRKLSADSPVFSGNVTVNGGTVGTAASTNLTLAGGSSGASLVLGQGGDGSATISPPGNGSLVVATTGSSDTVRATNTGSGSMFALGITSQSGRATLYRSDALGLYISASSSDGANSPIVFRTGTAAGDLRMTLAGSSGNLLIGGTTDITGSGGLKVFGTTASTSTTTGALQVAGGVGVAGAAFVGGNVTVGTGSNLDRDLIINGGAVGSYSSAVRFQSSGTDYWKIGRGSSTGGANFEVYDYQGTPGNRMTIASSTGAATFSGNLTVSGTGTHTFGTTNTVTMAAGVLTTTGAATFGGAIAIGNTVNTVTATLPNRTITMVIGGTTYYIHAKTTND